MKKEKIITTDRLILRQWRSEDLEPFAVLNSDPLVREYFSSTLNKQESDRIAKLISDEIDKNGYGFWAISVPHVSDFVGIAEQSLSIRKWDLLNQGKQKPLY